MWKYSISAWDMPVTKMPWDHLQHIAFYMHGNIRSGIVLSVSPYRTISNKNCSGYEVFTTGDYIIWIDTQEGNIVVAQFEGRE